MISFEIEVTRAGIESFLQFAGPVDSSFTGFVEPVPELSDDIAERNFRARCTRALQEACGKKACQGDVLLFTSGDHGLPPQPRDWRKIVGAHARCKPAPECPLAQEGGGEAGDWEPLRPAPNLPGMQAAVDMPQLYDQMAEVPVTLPGVR